MRNISNIYLHHYEHFFKKIKTMSFYLVNGWLTSVSVNFDLGTFQEVQIVFLNNNWVEVVFGTDYLLDIFDTTEIVGVKIDHFIGSGRLNIRCYYLAFTSLSENYQKERLKRKLRSHITSLTSSLTLWDYNYFIWSKFNINENTTEINK